MTRKEIPAAPRIHDDLVKPLGNTLFSSNLPVLVCSRLFQYLRVSLERYHLCGASVLMVPNLKRPPRGPIFAEVLASAGARLLPPQWFPWHPIEERGKWSFNQASVWLAARRLYDKSAINPLHLWSFKAARQHNDLPMNWPFRKLQYENVPKAKALSVIPLIAGGFVWGTLNVFYSEPFAIIKNQTVKDVLLEENPLIPPYLCDEKHLDSESTASWLSFPDRVKVNPNKPEVAAGIKELDTYLLEAESYLSWALAKPLKRSKLPFTHELTATRLPVSVYIKHRGLVNEDNPFAMPGSAAEMAIDFVRRKEERWAAVLFFDVRESTQFMCAELGAQQFAQYLSGIGGEDLGLYHRLIRAIAENGGEIDKTEGDGAMAIFLHYAKQKVPPHNQLYDCLPRATRAAVQMHSAFEEFKSYLLTSVHASKYEVVNKLRPAVGVAFGKIAIGPFGDLDCRAVTSLGPCVNMAKKLETVASRDRVRAPILVSVENCPLLTGKAKIAKKAVQKAIGQTWTCTRIKNLDHFLPQFAKTKMGPWHTWAVEPRDEESDGAPPPIAVAPSGAQLSVP